MMTIRRAGPGDLAAVLGVLSAAAADLHERGYDQWPDGSPTLGPGKIGAQISRGEFWIVADAGEPVGVIALSRDGDPDFWAPDELAEPAIYLSKAAVLPSWRGRGLGALMFRWATDYAWQAGVVWVRLDAWRTNTDLHDYYRRHGWESFGIVERPHRRSGAMFGRAARPDPEARAAFSGQRASEPALRV